MLNCTENSLSSNTEWKMFILNSEFKNLEKEYESIEIPNEDQVMSYYKIRQQLNNLSNEMLRYIRKPQYILPFLQPDRLVKVSMK